jgi:YbbR domain-containing protein
MARRVNLELRGRVRRFFGNFGLKVLALLLACAVWFFITGGRQVYRELAVPLEIVGVPEGCVLNGAVPRAVSVRVVGKGRDIIRLKPADFKLVVNVAGKEPGVYRVDLTPADVIYVGRGDVAVDGIVSEKILMLEIERRITKSVPVVAEFAGEPAAGMALGAAAVTPPKATLYGSAAILDKVYAVVVSVDVQGRDASFTTRVPVRAPSGITLVGAEEAEVKVVIGPPSRRNFPAVVVTVAGTKAPYKVSPPKVAVTLEGEATRLAALKPPPASVNPAGPGRYQVRVDVPPHTKLIVVAPMEVTVEPSQPGSE